MATSWDASKTSQPVGQKKWLSCCIQHWRGHTWKAVCSSEPHNLRWCEGPWMYTGRATKLGKGLEGMSCEEWLRNVLWACLEEEAELLIASTALYSSLRRWRGRCWFFLVSSARMHENDSNVPPRGGTDWILGSISLLRGWPNPRTGFLEKWLMSQQCQSLPGIWTILLRTCFHF